MLRADGTRRVGEWVHSHVQAPDGENQQARRGPCDRVRTGGATPVGRRGTDAACRPRQPRILITSRMVGSAAARVIRFSIAPAVIQLSTGSWRVSFGLSVRVVRVLFSGSPVVVSGAITREGV